VRCLTHYAAQERGTQGQRDASRAALLSAGVRVLPRSRVVAVGPPAGDAPDAPPLELRLEAQADAIAADVVLWTAGAAPAVGEALRASLGAAAMGALPTDDTLRVRGHERIFALGDGAAVAASGGGQLALTAQVAFQAADYAAWNLWAASQGRPLLPFRYQHLGEMMALGAADAAAVALPLPGGATLAGPAAALLRKAAYVYRMPTQAQSLKVGTAWLQRALSGALSGRPNL
jgi:NADH:ubiquinone reductase (non-electrogenic)